MQAREQIDVDDRRIIIPDDIGHEYSQECLAWLKDYDIAVPDLIHHKVRWSERNKQLIFIYETFNGDKIGCLQARNFRSGKSKYSNQGNVDDVMPIYRDNMEMRSVSLVIVEDAISAIKVNVSAHVDAMPLLGSYLGLRKIAKIKDYGYRRVIIWLDHDKYASALNMASLISHIGAQVRVIRTDLDPKLYAEQDIKDKIYEYV